MTILKWLVVLAAGGDIGGLAVLFLAQRAFIFPIPQTVRTPPKAAGFPEAEEHVLAMADGEKVIVWHVPAKPAHPVVLYFHGNGDFLAGFFGRFRDIVADGPGSSRCPIAATPGRVESRASAGCSRTRRPPMPLRRRDTVRTTLSSGAFRWAAVWRSRWPPSSQWER